MPEDKDGVVELIRSFYVEELNKHGYIFSYEKAAQDFDTAIQMDCVFSLVIDNGSIDGFIGGIIADRMFLSGMTAQELMWYVKPDKRRDGIKLLQAFERGCKDRGCDDIMMVAIEGTKASGIYELLGYKKKESMYFKEV